MNAKQTSRREFLRNTALASSGACLTVCSRSLFGQAGSPAQGQTVAPAAAAPVATSTTNIVLQGRAAAASAKIATQTLRNNVSVLMGSGGNIAVLTGPEGKLLIDSGYATSQPQIGAALAALSPDPLTHLINTHWHLDHTDGNEWMHGAGATIIAHANTLKRLSAPQDIAAFHAHLPAAPAGARPTVTFSSDHTLRLNGQALILKHYDPAHTDSDIFIHLPDADILHAGDTWFNGFYPFIDYSSGGSIDGMIAATERTLALVGKNTAIIPGHGPVGNQTELTEFHEMLLGSRERVAALKKQGKSLEEAQAAKPAGLYDSKWSHGLFPSDMWVALVYQGV